MCPNSGLLLKQNAHENLMVCSMVALGTHIFNFLLPFSHQGAYSFLLPTLVSYAHLKNKGRGVFVYQKQGPHGPCLGLFRVTRLKLFFFIFAFATNLTKALINVHENKKIHLTLNWQ